MQVYGIAGGLIDFARGPMRISALAGLTVAVAINVWIIAKLRAPEVRAEFDDSE